MSSTHWEKALIGTVIYDQKSWVEVMDLGAQDYASQQHKIIWPLIMDLASRDALTERTLIEALRSVNQLDSLGSETSRGEDYVHELVSLADLAGLQEFATQVREANAKRRIEQVGIRLTLEARNGKPSGEIVEEHIKEILSIKRKGRREPKPIGHDIQSQKKRIEKARKGEITEAWVSNIEAFKKIMPGLNDVDFAVYVAMTGSGKSSLLRYEALQTALRGQRVCLLTYENTIDECQSWSVSCLTGVDHLKILHPKMLSNKEAELVNEGYDQIEKLPWIIEEMHGDPLVTITAIVRRELLKGGLDLIMIDGMYLMGGNRDNAYQVISENSQGLRSLAQEIHVPIVATTQFNRGVKEKREPEPEDLLYAGENPARIVVAMTKKTLTPQQAALFPENLDEDGRVILGKNMKAVAVQGNVLKQTNGPIGTTDDIKWLKHLNRFETLTKDWENRQPEPRVARAAKNIRKTYPSVRATTFNPKPKPGSSS
jgi:replicative DNA helicase